MGHTPTARISPTFERLTSAADTAFQELYDIYSEAIPSRGQKSREQIAEMTGQSDYTVLAARRGGAVIGFTIMFAPPGEAYALLEYMAVEPARRGQGVGRALLEEAMRQESARGHAWTIVEVEAVHAEHELNRRRQEFYGRCGCRRVVGLDYILPLPGAGPPPEMELMVRPPTSRPELPRVQLHRWLVSIYTQVYGCNAGDERIARMMSSVRDPAMLD